MRYTFPSFCFVIPWILITISSHSQFVSPDLVLKNKIKSITQKSWNEGLLYSTIQYTYNSMGKIAENSHSYFNFQTGINHTSSYRYLYKGNRIICTFHYADEVLTDSTVHHVKWEGSNWIFTDTVYLIASGKIQIRQNSKTEDSKGILYRNTTFFNDSLENDDYRFVSHINDSTQITIEKMDMYYKGTKRTYQHDSTVEITTPQTYKSTTWQDGQFNRSLTRKFIDSILSYEITEELDFLRKRKIKHETWYDQEGNAIKKTNGNKKRNMVYYTYETHLWKGTKIKETVTYEGKRKIKEKSRSEFDQRDLPQHVMYYDRNNELTGKITWEYTYW